MGDALPYGPLLGSAYPLASILLTMDLDLRFVDTAFCRLIEDGARSQQEGLNLAAGGGAGSDVATGRINALFIGEIRARVHRSFCRCQLAVDLAVGVLAYQDE